MRPVLIVFYSRDSDRGLGMLQRVALGDIETPLGPLLVE